MAVQLIAGRIVWRASELADGVLVQAGQGMPEINNPTTTTVGLVVLYFALAVASPGHAESRSSTAEDQAAEVMLQAILSQPQATLPAEQSCLTEQPVTVGDYLAESLMLLTSNGARETQLTVNCDPVKNSPELRDYYALELFQSRAGDSLKTLDTDAVLFQCTLGFYYREGEYDWMRMLQALVDVTNSAIVEGTRRCMSIP